MALIYRTNSMSKRMKKKKKKNMNKRKPRKAKFPKDILKRKDGAPGLVTISQPFEPVLGTAYPKNRLNKYFNIDPNTLPPRPEPVPQLDQWIREALIAIAVKCTEAQDLTKAVVFPQPAWRRVQLRLHYKKNNVLTYNLRNLADCFKRTRQHYMDANAPQVVECLEESDLLWQNIIEPITGMVQIISEVMFRGHTDLEIHKIDGLKLARAIRIVGEEVDLTSTMLDGMIGMVATRWTRRTIVMALETARQWREITIKRWGLEDIYDANAPDTEHDDVNVNRTNLLGKPLVPPPPEGSLDSRKARNPGAKAKKNSPAVQEKANVEASSSTHKPPVLQPVPKGARPRGRSVLLLDYQPRPDPYELRIEARAKAMREREEREYTERCAERTMLENLPDEEPPITQQPTYHTRAYRAAARNGQPHHGLQMNDQDIELDPLRLAQIQGVDNTESVLSYPDFPTAHLPDSRTRTKFEPRRSVRRQKVRREKVDKGKNVKRRSAMKKDKAVVPESTQKDDKSTPQQSVSDKEGTNHAEVQDRVTKLNGHIISQVKGSIRIDSDNRIKIHPPLIRNETGKPLTSSLAKRNKESIRSKMDSTNDDGLTEEVRRVRFADPSPPTEETTSSRKGHESTRSRTSGEASSSRTDNHNVGESSNTPPSGEASSNRTGSDNVGESNNTRTPGEASSSHIGSRNVGESINTPSPGEPSSSRSGTRNIGESSRSRGEPRTSASARRSREIRSARRLSANRNGIEPSPSQSGRPFPIPLRVGNEVVPAPPMRQNQSQSPLVKGPVGFPVDRSLVPAPLVIRNKGSKSPLDNRGVDMSDTNSLMPAPLKLGQHRSKSPLDNRNVDFSNTNSLMPAPLKLGQHRSKSTLDNRGVDASDIKNMMPAPLKLGQHRSKSPLDNRGADASDINNMMPAPLKLGQHQSKSPLVTPVVGFPGFHVADRSALPAPLRLGYARPKPPVENRGADLPENRNINIAPATPKLDNVQSQTFLAPPKPDNLQSQAFLAPPKLGHKRSRSPLENRGVGSNPSTMTFIDYSESPIGPPPNRPLPPLPTERK